jgi:fructokinase
MENPRIVVGLGEVLWDLLPSGRQLGGAPANFAYGAHLLGDHAVIASRIGTDELGREIRQRLLGYGMSDEFLQTDSIHPTGTVRVHLDSQGQPQFEIRYPAAWDFLEWNDSWRSLAESADAVCFGSLAQRSAFSRATVRKFLDATRSKAVRIFDVNLRQSFYSAEVLAESMLLADVVKLNRAEMPQVAGLLAIAAGEDLQFARAIIQKFDVRLVSITRGAQGSVLASSSEFDEHHGFCVEIKDTVGAGDAFTAGLVHQYLRAGTLAQMNDLANRMGAWVASSAGAMPLPPRDGLMNALGELRANQA